MKFVAAALFALLIPLPCCASGGVQNSASCGALKTEEVEKDATNLLQLTSSLEKHRLLVTWTDWTNPTTDISQAEQYLSGTVPQHRLREKVDEMLRERVKAKQPTCLITQYREALIGEDAKARILAGERMDVFGNAWRFPQDIAVFYSGYFASTKCDGVGNKVQSDLAADLAKLAGTVCLGGTSLGAHMNAIDEGMSPVAKLKNRIAGEPCTDQDWADLSKALAMYAVDSRVKLVIVSAVAPEGQTPPVPGPDSVWCKTELPSFHADTKILPIFTEDVYNKVKRLLGKLQQKSIFFGTFMSEVRPLLTTKRRFTAKTGRCGGS